MEDNVVWCIYNNFGKNAYMTIYPGSPELSDTLCFKGSYTEVLDKYKELKEKESEKGIISEAY